MINRVSLIHRKFFFLGIMALVWSRYYDLLNFPVFNDQAIYIRWSQVLVDRPSLHNAFLSTIDGKQPLSMWLTAMVLPFFSDSIFAERVLSALFGVVTVLLGTYFLGRRFSNTAAAVFYLLCLVSPYILWFSRYALVESLLLFFTLISFILLWELYTRETSFISAGFLLIAVLTLGFLNKAQILLIGIASLAFPVIFWNSPQIRKRLFLHASAIMSLASTPLCLTWINNLLGLPLDPKRGQFIQNQSLFYLGNLLSKDDLEKWSNKILSNFGQVWDIASSFISWPVLAICVFSIAALVLQRERVAYLCLIYALVPVIILTLTVKEVFFRYFLMITPFLFIPASIFLGKHMEKKNWMVLLFAILIFAQIPVGYASMNILLDPKRAPFTGLDWFHQVSGWPSGYGVREAVKFIKEDSNSNNVLVLTDVSSGNSADGFATIFWNSGISVEDTWWFQKLPIIPGHSLKFVSYESKYTRPDWPVEVIDIKNYSRVYFVCRNSTYFPNMESFVKRNHNLKLRQVFTKPASPEQIHLYEWGGENILTLDRTLKLGR